MGSKAVYDPAKCKDLENIVDLVKRFLEYTDDLLKRDMISEELYRQLTRKKVQFLKDLEK